MRYTGLQQTGALRGFPISLIAKGDSNHFQPFVVFNEIGKPLQIACVAVSTGQVITLPPKYEGIFYWSKFTLTYTTTGSKSLSIFYINGTMIANWTDAGKVMRWSDSSTLLIGVDMITLNKLINQLTSKHHAHTLNIVILFIFVTLGGYSSSSTHISNRYRFLGWMDDLAFYNRVLSPHEIKSNW